MPGGLDERPAHPGLASEQIQARRPTDVLDKPMKRMGPQEVR
ncbi:MAG: hypothetical protein ACLQNE_15910 [Thermoguttaceae bacterium]